MSNRRRALWSGAALALALAFTGSSALAEETLADAIALAYETNPTLATQRANQRALFTLHVGQSAVIALGVGAIMLLAGATTMLANAAGPVITIYCLAVGLPKFELVGTLAWFFFIINAFKVPFSAGLGLIRADTLLFNLILVPAVVAGVFGGRWLLHRLPQRLFNLLMLGFAAIAALRLILS